jgi:hypothetical protein
VSLKTIPYGILSFPCSRHGVPVPANTFSARALLQTCSVAELAGLRRPAGEKIQDLWMSRFVKEMHWLPLIETLIGCDHFANPKEHAVFIRALKASNALRVCHRPRGRSEARRWASLLSQRIKDFCPDKRIRGLVQKHLSTVGNGGDVFFVSKDCEPAATQSQTQGEIWRTNSWILYRHASIGSRPLTDIEMAAYSLGTLNKEEDPAADQYKGLVSLSP